MKNTNDSGYSHVAIAKRLPFLDPNSKGDRSWANGLKDAIENIPPEYFAQVKSLVCAKLNKLGGTKKSQQVSGLVTALEGFKNGLERAIRTGLEAGKGGEVAIHATAPTSQALPGMNAAAR